MVYMKTPSSAFLSELIHLTDVRSVKTAMPKQIQITLIICSGMVGLILMS
jgi:hypothetical protein